MAIARPYATGVDALNALQAGESELVAVALAGALGEGEWQLDADCVAESRGLGEAMVGINVADLPVHHRLEDRGW